MSTIQPLNPNLGRIAFTWTEENPNGPSAIIDGVVANFAGVVGGETIDIIAGGVGPTTITLLAGDITAALIAARINATFAGLATVRPSGAIRLEHATDVVVDNIGLADFDKIGLPIISKNVANTAAFFFLMESNQDEIDRIDHASNILTIPDGANEVAIWFAFNLRGASRSSNPNMSIAWNNAIDGAAPSTLLDLYTDAAIFPPAATALTNPDPRRQSEVGSQQLVISGSVPTFLSAYWRKLIRVAIPAGSTGLRLVANAALANALAQYPSVAPQIFAIATFAARLR